MLTDISFDTFRHPYEVLKRYPASSHIVVDYRELTTQPRKTVLEIYHGLGLNVSKTYDSWLLAREDSERDHSTRFEYSIDDYELSRQRIEAELSDFFDRYNWQRESQA